ncbi:hypothetical protein BJV74DRAFT_796014 [Russula compacta]|nr:hypothetical protein BJV74DRAFT_796014 [Russula compacta]
MEESEDDTTTALKLKSKRKGAQPTPDNSLSDSEEEFANHRPEWLLVPTDQNPIAKWLINDSASLKKILKSERPSWASPKGLPAEALFNDDDDIIEVDQDRKLTANESKPEPAKPEWPEPAIKSLKDPRKLLLKSVPTNGATITNAVTRGHLKPILSILCWKWLYSAAKSEKADMIRRQVKEDIDFVCSLQDLVLARATTFQSNIKDSASKGVMACYNLVEHAYGALYEWGHGQCQQISFSQAAYEDVYQGHINMLQQFCKKHPNKCHQVLSTLYVAVTLEISCPTSIRLELCTLHVAPC